MSFSDAVDEAQAEFFVDSDLMGGETVTYMPEAGATREIVALVNRQPKTPISEMGIGRPVVSMTISVRNSAEHGIDLTTLNTGKDRILVARRKGGEAEPRAIGVVESQSAGMLLLSIR